MRIMRQTAFFLLCVIAASQAFAGPQPLVSLTSTASSTPTTSSSIRKKQLLPSTTALPMSTSVSGGAQQQPQQPVLVAAALKPPVALYEGAIAAGAAKAKSPAGKIFKLGIVAGCHIAFGAYLAISVGGACPGIAAENPGLQKLIFGAIGLPTGLIMTLVTGAELFTGNTALVTGALMEKKITKQELAKNWICSYAGNFLGSLLLAWLVHKTGTLGTSPAAVNIATAKCSAPWDVAFYRGILCNWLVCMAVYMASGSSTLIGKMTAVWFPIMAFVALGLDHSVANMFILPLGILRGAQITVGQMFAKNLIPVTLGNIVGGAVCVMMPYGTTLGNWFSKKKS